MNIPKHIVVFPDGNRRWAKEHNLSLREGYEKGEKKFSDFLIWCKDRGVGVVTVFGFSTENWSRPKEQVDFLLGFLEKYLGEGIDDLHKEGVKVKVIGQIEKLPASLRSVTEKAEKITENNKVIHLNLAVSYGGRWDILQAAQKIIREKIPAENLTEELFESYLSTAGLVAPDLIIRAGGEMRLSNFVLWQGAYAELYFSSKLWPDFTKEDFDAALEEFDRRSRRFGS